MNLLVMYAMQFVGLPYRWGGDDAIDGFDCSGFVQEVLHAFGAPPPSDCTAQGLHDLFQNNSASPRAGALVFFGKSERAITHVGLMISADLMLEAGGGGAKTTSRESAAAQNAFVRVRPVARRKDAVATLMPPYRNYLDPLRMP